MGLWHHNSEAAAAVKAVVPGRVKGSCLAALLQSAFSIVFFRRPTSFNDSLAPACLLMTVIFLGSASGSGC